MAVQMMNTDQFKTEIFDFHSGTDFQFKRDRPVILNFFGTWCGPCHAFRPVLEAAAEKHQGQLDVFKVDIDADPALPTLFGIRSVPTTVFFKPNDEPVLVMGNIGEEGLQKAINEIFGL